MSCSSHNRPQSNDGAFRVALGGDSEAHILHIYIYAYTYIILFVFICMFQFSSNGLAEVIAPMIDARLH